MPPLHESICIAVQGLAIDFIRTFERDLQEPSASALVAAVLAIFRQLFANCSRVFLQAFYNSLPYLITKLSSVIFMYDCARALSLSLSLSLSHDGHVLTVFGSIYRIADDRHDEPDLRHQNAHGAADLQPTRQLQVHRRCY